MKVLLINGSPNRKGCTNVALEEIAMVLNQQEIETEMFHIGKAPVNGCIGCNSCMKTGKCFNNTDCANDLLEKMIEADGIVVGSPVYFAGPNGALCALLDRVFYMAKHRLAFKPAAAIVSCRRAGSSASLDRLNKYFTIKRMPVVSSQYWNEIHGMTAEEAKQDVEGLQIMRTLAYNMAWLLKCVESNENKPHIEKQKFTNYIRKLEN